MGKRPLEVLKAGLIQLKESVKMLFLYIYSTENTFLKKTSIGWIMRPISSMRMQLLTSWIRLLTMSDWNA